MIFGMPSLIETDQLSDCITLCKELELDFIELNMNLPQYQLDRIDPTQLRELSERYGIFFTIHLDENLNISDFNTYIAQAYLRTVSETIELAKTIGCPIINMHLSKGVYFTLPDKKVYLFSQYREQYLKSIANFRDMCENLIGKSKIKICIENCDGYFDFQRIAIEYLLQSPVFGLTFDIGHNHGIGGTDEPFIMQNKKYLTHMHIHDALGKKNHLALGTGEIDLNKYVSLADATRCRCVLETKTISGLKQSVYYLKKLDCFKMMCQRF